MSEYTHTCVCNKEDVHLHQIQMCQTSKKNTDENHSVAVDLAGKDKWRQTSRRARVNVKGPENKEQVARYSNCRETRAHYLPARKLRRQIVSAALYSGRQSINANKQFLTFS